MKKIDLKIGMMTAIFCFGFATISSAQGQKGKGRNDRKEPPTYAQLLEKMDTNEDGKLAEDEVKGPLKESFSKIDTNEDGYISEEEFEKAPKPEHKRGKKNR